MGDGLKRVMDVVGLPVVAPIGRSMRALCVLWAWMVRGARLCIAHVRRRLAPPKTIRSVLRAHAPLLIGFEPGENAPLAGDFAEEFEGLETEWAALLGSDAHAVAELERWMAAGCHCTRAAARLIAERIDPADLTALAQHPVTGRWERLGSIAADWALSADQVAAMVERNAA